MVGLLRFGNRRIGPAQLLHPGATSRQLPPATFRRAGQQRLLDLLRDSSVARPLGRPPPVISSKPVMPVGALVGALTTVDRTRFIISL
jgi:hypothetical protein